MIHSFLDEEKAYRIEEISSWDFDTKQKAIDSMLNVLKNIKFDKSNFSVLEKIFFFLKILNFKEKKVADYLTIRSHSDLLVKFIDISKENAFVVYQLVLLLDDISFQSSLFQSYTIIRSFLNIIILYDESKKLHYDLRNNLFLRMMSIIANIRGKGLMFERKEVLLFMNRKIEELEFALDEDRVNQYKSLRKKIFQCENQICSNITDYYIKCPQCGVHYCSQNCQCLFWEKHKENCSK